MNNNKTPPCFATVLKALNQLKQFEQKNSHTLHIESYIFTALEHFAIQLQQLETMQLDSLYCWLSHLEAIQQSFAVRYGQTALLQPILQTFISSLEAFKQYYPEPLGSKLPQSKGPSNGHVREYDATINRKKQKAIFETQQAYDKEPEFHIFLQKLWLKAIQKQHKSPKIFISYAWGSKDLCKDEAGWLDPFVLTLAEQCQWAGLRIELDQFDSGLGHELSGFMQRLMEADHVIVISDTTMAKKLNIPSCGVVYEMNVIIKYLQQHPNALANNFIYPLLLGPNNDWANNTPPSVRHLFQNIAEDPMYTIGYLAGLKNLIHAAFDWGINFNAEFQQLENQTDIVTTLPKVEPKLHAVAAC